MRLSARAKLDQRLLVKLVLRLVPGHAGSGGASAPGSGSGIDSGSGVDGNGERSQEDMILSLQGAAANSRPES